MDYSPWGHKESGTTERLTFSVSFTNFKLLIFYIILFSLHIFFPYPLIISEVLHFLQSMKNVRDKEKFVLE